MTKCITNVFCHVVEKNLAVKRKINPQPRGLFELATADIVDHHIDFIKNNTRDLTMSTPHIKKLLQEGSLHSSSKGGAQ